MASGIFDLSNFDKLGENDIIPLSESGDGFATISIPGGDTEKPGSGGTTISAEVYNNALTALKKSFKEATDLIEVLEGATVVSEPEADPNEEFVENALLAAYEDGPMFEAVHREDKDTVKGIVRNLREKIRKDFTHDGIVFYRPNLVARVLLGLIPSPLTIGNLSAGISQIWNTRLWQVVGIACVEGGNIKSYCDKLTEKYEDELGEYKILFCRAPGTIADCFRVKFNWKNQKVCFFILIDRKVPSELKSFQKQIDSKLKTVAKENPEGKSDAEKKAIKEAVEWVEGGDIYYPDEDDE